MGLSEYSTKTMLTLKKRGSLGRDTRLFWRSWKYWTDDEHIEFIQGSANHNDEVETASVMLFVSREYSPPRICSNSFRRDSAPPTEANNIR
ncbi:hypothetical protein YC2023_021009 [Brassica napus]